MSRRISGMRTFTLKAFGSSAAERYHSSKSSWLCLPMYFCLAQLVNRPLCKAGRYLGGLILIIYISILGRVCKPLPEIGNYKTIKHINLKIAKKLR
jgi:hypothetical protein